MADDEWIRAAMTDNAVVAELLIRVKLSHATPSARYAAVLPPPGWGLRQPRSKPVFRCARKDQEPERCSPTTPLSWSGGASPSATGDGGFEDSSRLAGRSKGASTNEAINTTTGRRSRRKKTFAELKEEEGLLLKERIYLRKELATLHATVMERRTTNVNLKRMKLDLNLQSKKQGISTSVQQEEAYFNPHQIEASPAEHTSLVLPKQGTCENLHPSDPCKVQRVVESQDSFMLPDLNMMPFEEDSVSETLYGMS